MERSVLNVDIAAFPVAVERVIDRGLRDRPVVVAPPGSVRATILSVSSEAAREGVRQGMAVSLALRRCPCLYWSRYSATCSTATGLGCPFWK